MEHADDIIFTVNADGLVFSMNSFGYRFFKKQPGEVLGACISGFFSGECPEVLLKTAREIFADNESQQVTCLAVVDRSEYWVGINFSGLVDERGHVHKVLGIGRDVTERICIQEQMFHTEKLASMGTLAAGVAHEINNPLAIILGFTDMLLERTSPGSDTYDMLKTIERQGLNGKRVVENLLSFARHTEHKGGDVDINRNLEDVLLVVRNTLALNKIAVIRDCADPLPVVRGEPEEFQ